MNEFLIALAAMANVRQLCYHCGVSISTNGWRG